MLIATTALVDRTEDPPVTAQPADGLLRQLIERNHDEAEEMHKRLRETARDHKILLDHFEDQQAAILRRLQQVESTKPNVENMAWSTKSLTAIVLVAFGLGGGMWQLHTDIDKVTTQATNMAKTQDDRNAALDKALAAALAESRLNGIEIGNLKNQLTTYLLQRNKP